MDEDAEAASVSSEEARTIEVLRSKAALLFDKVERITRSWESVRQEADEKDEVLLRIREKIAEKDEVINRTIEKINKKDGAFMAERDTLIHEKQVLEKQFQLLRNRYLEAEDNVKKLTHKLVAACMLKDRAYDDVAVLERQLRALRNRRRMGRTLSLCAGFAAGMLASLLSSSRRRIRSHQM